MLRRLEDVTVISGEEFHAYEGEMIFVDTDCPFKGQPLSQVFIAIGDSEDELPGMWQESLVFGGDIFSTYEPNVIHTFISLDLKEQLDPAQYLFIKVIAIGDTPDLKQIKRV